MAEERHPIVLPMVPYPDMRIWQRIGVKLWRQRIPWETRRRTREGTPTLPASRRMGSRVE